MQWKKTCLLLVMCSIRTAVLEGATVWPAPLATPARPADLSSWLIDAVLEASSTPMVTVGLNQTVVLRFPLFGGLDRSETWPQRLQSVRGPDNAGLDSYPLLDFTGFRGTAAVFTAPAGKLLCACLRRMPCKPALID